MTSLDQFARDPKIPVSIRRHAEEIVIQAARELVAPGPTTEWTEAHERLVAALRVLDTITGNVS